jgi:pimeloyl-ACP methyl ester carboxylesterase
MKKNNLNLLLVLSFIFAGTVSLASIKDHKMMQYLSKSHKGFLAASRYLEATTEENTFDQILNPDVVVTNQNGEVTIPPKADVKMYKQRYFINSDLAIDPNGGINKSAPIFLTLCGEWECSASEFSWVLANARRLHAHMVALEHRYYGKSLPFTTLSVENLKYLKTTYAVSDIARFVNYLKKTRGLTGKLIVLGGSYSANLASDFRLEYPNLAIGALASSGPVHAVANFELYDKHVSDVAGPACGDAMRDVVKQLDASVNDPVKLAEMKKLFQASDIIDTQDFLMVVADMAATGFQYGMHKDFCATLLAGDHLQGFATGALDLFAKIGMTPVQDTPQFVESENELSGARAWTWQTCTEYGYWQTAYHDPAQATRSQLVNEAYYNHMCDRVFGIKMPVDTQMINDRYYAPLFSPSVTRIFFTNGENDPWSEISYTAKTENRNPALPVYLISDSPHTSDLHSPTSEDNDSLKLARQMFSDFVDQWLSNPEKPTR